MIDLHTHTLVSDGALLPSELARRAEVIGYTVLGLADHMDDSNLDEAIPRLVQWAERLNRHSSITVIPGCELTHIPPSLFEDLTKKARDLGAAVVVAHGESPVEPVAPGTNAAAIRAGVDILAHPGLITAEEVELAVERGVLLEITCRKGHGLANGHVARLAKSKGAKMVINTDHHAPGELMTREFARTVVIGAGLDESDLDILQENARALVSRVGAP
jgi:putative hydrolase